MGRGPAITSLRPRVGNGTQNSSKAPNPLLRLHRGSYLTESLTGSVPVSQASVPDPGVPSYILFFLVFELSYQIIALAEIFSV